MDCPNSGQESRHAGHDPQEKRKRRHQFIRLQCHLSQLPANAKGRKELVNREAALLVAHSLAWREALPPILRYQPFIRGFVETASMTTGEFLEHAEQIFSLAPIRHLHVKYSWDDGNFARFVASPYLARLRTLDLDGCSWAGDENRILFFDSTGTRYAETRLSESPEPEKMAA